MSYQNTHLDIKQVISFKVFFLQIEEINDSALIYFWLYALINHFHFCFQLISDFQ